MTEQTEQTDHLTAAAAIAELADAARHPRHFAVLMRHGSMSVEVYAPQGHDPQTPHAHDELYVVIAGSGTFRNGQDLHAFGAGDVIFVPAGRVHRFETFSADFSTWVIFYGPDGGER